LLRARGIHPLSFLSSHFKKGDLSSTFCRRSKRGAESHQEEAGKTGEGEEEQGS